MKFYPHAIVNDFYENPDAIRKFALAQKYQFCHERPDFPYVYPGCRTQDLFKINPVLFSNICKKLISVYHNAEHDYMGWSISSSFQVVTAEYGQGVIHRDHNTVFAAVLYLTPDAPLDSGTSLFKPNKTFDEAKYEKAIGENDDRFKAGEIIMDTSYHSMFDEVVRINNVYNTLIIYEGDNYHAANQFFGDNNKNGRLAQVFFVSKVDAQKESSFPINRVKAVRTWQT